ncbi:MAG: class I SAM-dependent methyltransferase [Myxococcales bacterium]|nr:class I SAM-dependent methyltransferase [Myxococcales bacterium]
MSRGGSGAVYDAERDSASLAALRVSLEGDAVAQVAALPADVAEVWSRYAALAAQWAARTDLTAARSAGALLEVLFVDALALLSARLIDDGAVLMDVGAGAGAPTLPIVLARPDLRAILIEPRRRRVAFLRTAVGALALERRVRVVEGRAEPGGRVPEGAGALGRPTLALSRATFAPERWRALGAALAPEVLVLTSGEALPDESPRRACRYRVPSSGAPRWAGVYGAGLSASSSTG